MRRYPLIRVIWVPLLIMSLMLSGCQSSSAPSNPPTATNSSTPSTPTPKALPAIVGIGTTPIGGAYYMVGTGLAKVISDRSPIKAIVKPSSGANAFNPLLDTGELELGIEGLDTAWAYKGVSGYDKPMKNIRVLVRGNEMPTIGLVVRVDSGINSLKDLKGKRVASGYGGFQVGQEITNAYLESVGLTMKDVKAVPVADAPSALRAVQEGRADASFGGSSTGALLIEVDQATPLKVLNYGDIPPDQTDKATKEQVQALQKYCPSARVLLQKKEGFLKSDATVVGYSAWLTSSTKLSTDAAYEITKTVYENDKELWPLHVWLKGWTQKNMFEPNPAAPYHEGAIRFWKEKGLWTPEAEANQKKLLG